MKSVQRSTVLLGIVLGLGSLAGAQVVIQSGSPGYSGPQGRENVVRDAQGVLYALSVGESGADRPLLLHTSTNGGASWSLVPFTFNEPGSGLNPPNPTNTCALAIDAFGQLHAVWGSYHYPSYYNQYYRNFHPLAGFVPPVVDITAQLGNPQTSRTAGMFVAVDAQGTVWIAAQSGSSWIEQLIHSTQPYGAGGTFASVGPISPSLSAQDTQIAIDTQGRIHCTYYRNLPPGIFEHRTYTWSAGWSAETVLGDLNIPNDTLGTIVSDALGNVHALYVRDNIASSGLLPEPKFRYRRWDSATGWGPEVFLADATNAQFGTNSANVFSLACTEATGKVFAVYRDFASGGSLRVAEKDLAANAFTNLPDLAPATAGVNEYFAPTMRGTLGPVGNRTETDLDVTWRAGTAAPFSLVVARVREAGLGNYGTGTPGCAGTAILSANSEPAVGNGAFALTVVNVATNAAGLLAMSGAPLAIPLPIFGISVWIDPSSPAFFSIPAIADPTGRVVVSIPIPPFPALAGGSVFAQHVWPDACGPLGLAATDGLQVTLQP